MKRAKTSVLLIAIGMIVLSIMAAFTFSILNERSGPVRNYFESKKEITYEVVYDLNGAEGTVETQTFTGLQIEYPEYTFDIQGKGLTRDGYSFLGWARNADTTAVDFVYNAASETFSPSQITLNSAQPTLVLHAVWQENQAYVLTYNDNHPDGEVTTVTQLEDPMFTIALPKTEQEYYLFAGWAYSADAQAPEIIYDYENQIFIPATITLTEESRELALYAVWEVDTGYKDYSIVYEVNLPDDVPAEAVAAPAKQEKRVKADAYEFTLEGEPTFQTYGNLSADQIASQYGLIFTGWSLEEDGGVTHQIGDAVVLNSADATELPLYAVWERQYYVEYVSTVTDPAAVKYSQATNQPTQDNNRIVAVSSGTNFSVLSDYENTGYFYKRTGYVLVGFSLNPDTREPDEHISQTLPGLRNIKTLYAIWAEGSYALTYDANGGAGAPVAQVYKDAPVTEWTFDIQTPADMKPGEGASDAVFMGWAYSADVEDESQINFPYDAETNTFTPAQITLTENEPTKVLHAIWKYHYVLSFDKGHNPDEAEVPSPVEGYSISKQYSFDVPDSPLPKRTDYQFQLCYADTLDRKVGETKYYVSSTTGNVLKKVTLNANETKKTVYARYLPMSGYTVNFNLNGGSSWGSMPKSISNLQNNTESCVMLLPSEKPDTRSGYTFVGWSTISSATYEWLYDDDDSTVIYRGYSDVTSITINGDISSTVTLFAVWAPDITITVKANGNGGIGQYWLSESYKENCTTRYRWKSPTSVTSPTQSISKTVTFEDYRSQSVFDLGTLNGKNRDSSGTTGSTLYQMTKTNCILLGFSPDKKNPTPEYTLAAGNLTLNVGNTQNVNTSGNPTGTNSYKSNGTYTLSGITVDLNSRYISKNGNTYTLTLYAVWRANVDTYRVVVEKTDGTKVELGKKENIPITNGTSSCVFATNELAASPYAKTGYVHDFTHTYGSTTADYTVTDTWHGNTAASTFDSSYTNQRDFVRTGYYQTWHIDSNISLDSGMEHLSCDPDTSSDNIQFVYTLTLYPIEKAGQLYRLTVHTSNMTNGRMYRLWFDRSGATGKFAYDYVSTDSITATARPEASCYTWAENTAGKFYGYQKNVAYEFTGFAESQTGMPIYTSSHTSTKWTHDHFIISDSIGYQYWDTIHEAITVYNTENPSSSNGIPLYTKHLYPQWRVYKQYTLTYNANGGSSNSSATQYYILQTETHCDFNTTSHQEPTRTGYKFLGYAYTKERANAGLVDIAAPNEQLTQTIRVEDNSPYVTINSNFAPITVNQTLYAVWELQQEFRVTFNPNGGTGSGSTSSQRVELSENGYTFRVKPSSTTLNGFQLVGYSYNLYEAGNTENPVIHFTPDEEGYYTIPVVKATDTTAATPNTNTEVLDGADITTMTLYAVWQENSTTFKLSIDPNYPTGESGTPQVITETVSSVTQEHQFAANKNISITKTGYRLAGLAYADDPDNTIVCTITNGKTDSVIDLVFAEDGGTPGVTEAIGSNNLATYTLPMKAVWVKQNRFYVEIDPNDGYIMSSGSSAYEAASRSLSASNSSTWWYDVGETEITLSNGYFLTYLASNPVKRDGQVFQGFAFEKNSKTADFTLNTSTSNSSTHLQYVVQAGTTTRSISFNLDEMIDKGYITSTTTDGITYYTLKLYAVWTQQHYFRVKLDPAGGVFGSTAGHSVTSGQVPVETPSTSFSVSYSDSKTIYNLRPGYTLLGYSYTDWRVNNTNPNIDFPVTTSGTTVSLGSVTVDSANTTGKTITVFTETRDNAQIRTTELTLYAVYGTKLLFSSESGTTNMPYDNTGVIVRYEPDATTNRIFEIPAVTPVYKQFTFYGWTTRDNGDSRLEYGAEGHYIPAQNVTVKNAYEFDANTGYDVLYAIWAYRFDLFYDLNGEGATNAPDNAISYNTYKSYQFNVSTLVPERPGYVFLGWEDPDVPGTLYAPGDPFVMTADETTGAPVSETLRAVWQEASPVQEEPLLYTPQLPANQPDNASVSDADQLDVTSFSKATQDGSTPVPTGWDSPGLGQPGNAKPTDGPTEPPDGGAEA